MHISTFEELPAALLLPRDAIEDVYEHHRECHQRFANLARPHFTRGSHHPQGLVLPSHTGHHERHWHLANLARPSPHPRVTSSSVESGIAGVASQVAGQTASRDSVRTLSASDASPWYVSISHTQACCDNALLLHPAVIQVGPSTNILPVVGASIRHTGMPSFGVDVGLCLHSLLRHGLVHSVLHQRNASGGGPMPPHEKTAFPRHGLSRCWCAAQGGRDRANRMLLRR